MALLNHPGHSSQKSHGRKGGGAGVGGDISRTIDYDALPTNQDFTTDSALGAILTKQGFDGEPDVVGKAEFDRAVAAGEVEETFRGIQGSDSSERAEQFRSGDLYVGTGIHGNGTYVTTNGADAQGYASRFSTTSDGGTVMRVGLRRDAKVVTDKELQTEMDTYRRANKDRQQRVDELDREMRDKAADTDDDDTAGRIAIYDQYKTLKEEAIGAEYQVRDDPGRYAALKGYDAIRVTGEDEGELVILNRTAVIVEQA